MTELVEHVLKRQAELLRVPPARRARAAARVFAIAANVAQLWRLGLQPDAQLRRSLVSAASRLLELGGGIEAESVLSVAMPIAMHWRNGIDYPAAAQPLLHNALVRHFRRRGPKARAA